jgi:hypothetical protein
MVHVHLHDREDPGRYRVVMWELEPDVETAETRGQTERNLQ